MLIKKWAIGLIALGLAQGAAADFLFELEGAISSFELEVDEPSEFDVTTDTLAAEATLYFGPVSTQNGVPYREAAFLDHASGVNLYIDDSETERDTWGDTYDSKIRWLSGWFVIPGSELVLGVGVLNGDYGRSDSDGFELNVGVYIGDAGLLRFYYANEEFDNASPFGSGLEIKSYEVNYKQVIRLRGDNYLGLDFSAISVDNESAREDSFTLANAITVYFARNMGLTVGLDLSFVDDEGFEDIFESDFSVEFHYDFTEQFGLFVGTSGHASDSDDEDSDYGDREYEAVGSGFQFGLNARF